MRKLTKLEARMLKLTPTHRAIIDRVLAGEIVHPRWLRNGSGQHYEIQGISVNEIKHVLERLKIFPSDMLVGNDAPRKGVEGSWIRLSPSGRRKVRRMLADDGGSQ